MEPTEITPPQVIIISKIIRKRDAEDNFIKPEYSNTNVIPGVSFTSRYDNSLSVTRDTELMNHFNITTYS